MSYHNLHIIQRLKRQPKQGTPSIWDTIGAGTNGITNSANETIAGIGKLNAEIRNLAKQYTNAIDKTKWLEDANESLQQTFGLNIENATVLGAELDNLSTSLGVGGNKLRKYRTDLKALIGGFAGVKGAAQDSQKFLYRTQVAIQNNLKLSADVANKFTQYAALTGKKSDEMVARYAKIAETMTNSYGIQVSARDLIQETANLTEDLQVQYGKIPQKLTLAIVKAKALGLSMADLNKTGQNLLNIESSIGQEIEYQLLSGRRLVDEVSGESLTNAYRQATLQGDANKQAELMNKIIGQESKTLKNNLFARQQMAQLLGTDEATVARTLAKQELLSQLGGDATKLMDLNTSELNAAVQSLDSFAAMTQEQKDQYLKDLNETMDTRTTEQRMADALDTMVSKGIMLRAGGPATLGEKAKQRSDAALAGTGDVTAGLTTLLNTPTNANIAGEAFTDLAALGVMSGALSSFGTGLKTLDIKGPFSANAPVINISTDGMTEAQDLFMGPGSGRAILGPEGAFSLNNKDSIIAGTNLGGGSADMSGFVAAIVSAIKQQTEALTSNSGINAPYWS